MPLRSSTESQKTNANVSASLNGEQFDGRRMGDIILRMRHLEFAWPGAAEPTLRFKALDFQLGESVFIHGLSGSGKSTLLSLMAGMIVPQKGSVESLGAALEMLSDEQRDHYRAHHVGYIFQMFNLIPYLSVVENVLLPCRFSQERRERALRSASQEGLSTLADEARRLLTRLGLGEDNLWKRPVTALSVGQQQRVAAARALIGAPELLIADEPTSSLDEEHREAFVRLLFEESASQRSTLIMVSHDMSMSDLFDRVIHLADLNQLAARGAR